MVTSKRSCAAKNEQGEPCRQPPLRDGERCFWHDAAHADEATEARRLGGLRRRREKAVEGAYDLEGLEDVPAIRRLVEVAALDTLALDNSIARARTLITAALAAAKLLEVGEFEERLVALETAVQPVPAATRRRTR
jgi:hypothetical protein